MKLLPLKIYEFLVGVLTAIVVIVVLAWIVPQKMGIKPFIVKSGSMEPVIQTGAVAFIDTNDTDVEVGDIVTYVISEDTEVGTGSGTSQSAEDGTLVTHRIVDKDGDMFITKGDNNDVIDLKEVSPDQIMGTYKFNVPRAGFIFAKYGNMIPITAVIWVGGLNFLSILLNAIFTEDDESDDKAAKKAASKKVQQAEK